MASTASTSRPRAPTPPRTPRTRIFVYGGASGFTTYPAVGDSVRVTGKVVEFFGSRPRSPPASPASPDRLARHGDRPRRSSPAPTAPCRGTACLTAAELDDVREDAEGELFQPTAPFTVTDVLRRRPYYSNGTQPRFLGEIGLAANSDQPLVAPTEVIDAQATAAVAERKALQRRPPDHPRRRRRASTYSTDASTSDHPFPWFTADHTVRVGCRRRPSPSRSSSPTRFNAWKLQPQAQVTGAATGASTFEQTRPGAPPRTSAATSRSRTFNVLNYFPTTGEEFVASGLGTCTYFNDRDGNPIANNSCDPNGPRGAANEANLVAPAGQDRRGDQHGRRRRRVPRGDRELGQVRQADRDDAITALVDALNADAGAGTLGRRPVAGRDRPARRSAEQDVIRNGVHLQARHRRARRCVRRSWRPSTGEAFDNAREPLAQAFKPVGDADADAFAVIVNHFKSKGSGAPATRTGQGNANDRPRRARPTRWWPSPTSSRPQRGIDEVFLTGDFNAYSEEDPIQVLEAAGYTNLESTSGPTRRPTASAVSSVRSTTCSPTTRPSRRSTGVDVWDINALRVGLLRVQPLQLPTSPTSTTPNPFRSSDHNPEIVGIDTRLAAPADGRSRSSAPTTSTAASSTTRPAADAGAAVAAPVR